MRRLSGWSAPALLLVMQTRFTLLFPAFVAELDKVCECFGYLVGQFFISEIHTNISLHMILHQAHTFGYVPHLGFHFDSMKENEVVVKKYAGTVTL